MIVKFKYKIVKTVFSVLTVLVLLCSFALNIYAADSPPMYSAGGSIYGDNYSDIFTGNVDYNISFYSHESQVDYSVVINPSVSKATTLDEIQLYFNDTVKFYNNHHDAYVNLDGLYSNFVCSDNFFSAFNDNILPNESYFRCHFDLSVVPESYSYDPDLMTVEARDFYYYLDPNQELYFHNYDDFPCEGFIKLDCNSAFSSGAAGQVCYIEAGVEDTLANYKYYNFSLSSSITDGSEYSQFYVIPTDQSFDGAYSEPTLIYIKYFSLSLPLSGSFNYFPGTYYSFNYDFRNVDLSSVVFDPIDPDIFKDYTSWLGTAVGGFLDLELAKGFTLGGILMVLIGFSVSLWFLKVFAGG